MSGPNPPSESQAMEQTVPAEIGPLATRPAGAEPLARGMAIGRYTVLDRIGAGGMGVVYSAFDPELDRKVALKVLHSSGSGSVGGTHGRNRLLREAQAMAKLHHPNVITVHDVGTFGDRVFVAMEFVDGQTLREWHGDGVHDWPEIIDVFVRAGRGLAAAHAVGLVHRDFKPDNVLVGNDGRVLVMDFGLARQAGASGTPEPGTPRVQASSPVPEGLLTRTGTVLGTPAYMAPEQHTSGTIGPATDQFSFCVALYEALYGERPFSGNSVASLALAVLEGKPRRPRRDAPAPVWLFEVLERGLLADPHERFPSMDALLAELQRDPPTSGRPMLTVAIALGVAGLIVGGYLWTRPDPIARCDEERRQFTPLVDDDRERAMEAAFEASGIRHAPRAWQSASQRLMGYDAEWNEQWRMACEAGYARPADAAPMLERRACLETLRGEARSVVDSLSLVDQGTVDIAVDAAQDLAVPGDCALPPSQRPLTLDPSKGELARAIAEARTAVRLGRWREAADRLSGFVVTPVPIDDAALEAELLTLHGRAEQHLDRVDAGRASLRRAVLAASIAGNSRLERDAWLAIAAGLAHSVHDVDQAWPTLVATEAAIVRDGDDVAARRQWLVAHGDIHSALGRHREALDRYDRATTSIRAGTDPTVVAALSARRCIALSAIELPTDAAPACSSAVDTFAEELGDTHPRVAAALAELGIAQLAEGDEGAAAASFERARIALDPEDAFVVRADTVLGPLAPLWPHEQVPSTNAGLLARVLDRIGLAERSRRRFGPAARAHAAAAGLLARTRTGSVGYPLVNLGVALLDLGRPADALAQLQRGVDELRDDLPDDHPDLPIAELDLANALASTGQWTDAGALYQDVLDVWEERLPPDHPLLAYALTGLARARLELDDASAAIDPLERAYELREDAREDGTNLAETAWLLARALLGSGSDEARAIELATRALATIGAPAITDPLELRRVLSGGALVGVTDRLTPASLPLTDRTPLGIPVGR